MYYTIDPEVTGELGEDSSYDEAQRAVDKGPLQLIFEGWLGDDLIAMSPFWFVTEQLASAMKEASLTEFELDPVTVSKGDQWELAARFELPPVWFRLIPTGSIESGDDVALDDGLVVSNRALEVFQSFSLTQATVTPFDETSSPLPSFDTFLAEQAEKAKALADTVRVDVQERIEDSEATLPLVDIGDVSDVLLLMAKALGSHPESREVTDVQALLGPLGERSFTPRGRGFDKDYLILEYWHSGTMMEFGNDELSKAVVRLQPEWGWAPFPYPDKLLHGITTKTTKEELLAILGSPMKTMANGYTWQSDGYFLHAWYNPAGLLGRLSVMLQVDGS